MLFNLGKVALLTTATLLALATAYNFGVLSLARPVLPLTNVQAAVAPAGHVCATPMPPLIFHGQGDGGEPLDKTLYELFFADFCNGVFVDVGANDGTTMSNSLLFEESFGWRGLCIEPNPTVFAKLAQARPDCVNVNGGISAQSGVSLPFMQVTGYAEMLSGWVVGMPAAHMDRIKNDVAQMGGAYEVIQVPAYRLDHLFAKHGFTVVDLLSIDVEGHELQVLESIDWNAVTVRYVVAEENSDDARKAVSDFMREHGYERLDNRTGFNGLYRLRV